MCDIASPSSSETSGWAANESRSKDKSNIVQIKLMPKLLNSFTTQGYKHDFKDSILQMQTPLCSQSTVGTDFTQLSGSFKSKLSRSRSSASLKTLLRNNDEVYKQIDLTFAQVLQQVT